MNAIKHGTHMAYNFHKCRCAECRAHRSEWSKNYYRKNRDELAKKARESRRADPDRHRQHALKYKHSPKGREQYRRYYAENKETLLAQNRANKFKARYGITEEEVERLCVDHDHDSGAFRGLLCDKCNRGLGYFADNPTALRVAASYLEA